MAPSTQEKMANGHGEASKLSEKYDTPMGLAHGTMQALKERIKTHYDLASDYYLSLWGEHIHHGYWPTPESKATDTKEVAQTNLMNLLLTISSLPVPGQSHDGQPTGLRVLDVGCGLGGTSRYLASALGCTVTGITISGKQVEMATRLSKEQSSSSSSSSAAATSATSAGTAGDGFIEIGKGKVRFQEMDAEKMGAHADFAGAFDVVWISEALSHIPGKKAFFENAHKVLKDGGKLVIADWFKGEGLDEANGDIKAIEDGMLLPPLCTQAGYVDLAKEAGFTVRHEPKDISQDVSKTWDISWSLVQNPSLWAFALSQGRDGIAFLQAFRAMRRGYANGSFRYAVMAFDK